MSSSLEIFTRRVFDEWLGDFCDDENRRYSHDGFNSKSIKLSEFDARNFMRALDSGLVKDSGGGRYRCPRSSAFDQIFWSGRKSIGPRPITLWVEPVITIGTIARLGLDYGWPAECLCMQSKDWAFDFAAFKEISSECEFLAGEVKKTRKELDSLVMNLMNFGQQGLSKCPSSKPEIINSFKKWSALLRCKAPLFWAVGPDNYTHLFAVDYKSENVASFTELQLDELRAPSK